MVIMVKLIYSGKAVNLSAFRHMTHDANVDHQRPDLSLDIFDWSIIHDIIMYICTPYMKLFYLCNSYQLPAAASAKPAKVLGLCIADTRVADSSDLRLVTIYSQPQLSLSTSLSIKQPCGQILRVR